MQDKIFEMLLDQDEITWKTMIFDLVKSEEMDPWDIDISLLAQRFLETLRKLKEMDFRVSGKILLAAAILLRLKSNRLMNEDLNRFDQLLASREVPEEEFFDEFYAMVAPEEGAVKDEPRLVPRTPQPRKRKVSVFDLVSALEKALEVHDRRPPKAGPGERMKIPKKGVDISVIIKDVYDRIWTYFKGRSSKDMLSFTELIPSDTKEDKIYTFIPLLHLTNQRTIDLHQKKHFDEIYIQLLQTNKKALKLEGLG